MGSRASLPLCYPDVLYDCRLASRPFVLDYFFFSLSGIVRKATGHQVSQRKVKEERTWVVVDSLV